MLQIAKAVAEEPPIAEMSPVKQSELEGQAQHCIAGAND